MMIILSSISAQQNFKEIFAKIDNGSFSAAIDMIDSVLALDELTISDELLLNFELERMNRIRLDFKKTKIDIIEYTKNYLPEVTEEMLDGWERDGSLEFKIIDGEKLYFNRAHTNLFRINKELREIKKLKDGTLKDSLDFYLEKNLPRLVDKLKSSGENKPTKIRFNYKVSVKSNVVPHGELIKAWLPTPNEIHDRQSNVKLFSVNSDQYVLSNKSQKHNSIYFEKISIEDQPTVFEYSVEYLAKPQKFFIDPHNIIDYNKSSDIYKEYTSERLPHIEFTDEIKTISKEIVGSETNPYLIAKRIFTWINDNIPWAGAREYSTIRNISDYCLSRMHGDCGIKTILFMTLCRYNGIPAKWQSGWMMHPGNVNLHDWCEIYFEGIGWVPVDQSFGIVDSEINDVKYYFLDGIDQFHMIVNEDYSEEFFPAKSFERSETVDFQRGEIEWRGGNLYFDKWNYNMEVEYLD